MIATHPHGASTVIFGSAGKANLNSGGATGSFVADHGTGDLAGFHASGKIEAQLVGAAACEGIDIGLC
ncbi:MAG: hypothetical protein C4345_13490 [Chloroflexota bacterium]